MLHNNTKLLHIFGSLYCYVMFNSLLRNHLASKLEYLNLSGCNWISDLTLERLAKVFRPSMKYTGINAFKTSENNNKCLSSANKCTCKEFQDSLCEKPRLCCLRLSGCHLITDKGLRYEQLLGYLTCIIVCCVLERWPLLAYSLI